MSNLIVLVYPTEEKAEEVRNKLFSLLDANPLGVTLNTQSGLQQALHKLESEIAASVV